MRSILWASSLALALAGCASTKSAIKPQVEQVPVEVVVAVATGCIDAKGRPAVPARLQDRYTPEQWAALAPGAKAEAFKAQAGERMNYGDLLYASTSACK